MSRLEYLLSVLLPVSNSGLRLTRRLTSSFLKVLGFANCPDVSSATFIAIATSTAGKCPSVSLKISNCFTLTNSGLSLASLLASSDSKIPGFRLQTVLTSHQKYTVSYGFMLARVVTQF